MKSSGADPNVAKVTGVTPLFAACKTSYSAKGDDADATSLSLASALLASSAEADLCPHDGCSPLFVAARRGRTEVVRLLLDKGRAEPGRRNRRAMPKRLKSSFKSFLNNISQIRPDRRAMPKRLKSSFKSFLNNISQIRPDCGDGSGGGRPQGMHGSALARGGKQERRVGGNLEL